MGVRSVTRRTHLGGSLRRTVARGGSSPSTAVRLIGAQRERHCGALRPKRLAQDGNAGRGKLARVAPCGGRWPEPAAQAMRRIGCDGEVARTKERERGGEIDTGGFFGFL